MKCTLLMDVNVNIFVDGKYQTITLKDVRCMPDFGMNIISEAPFLKKGCCITKNAGVLTVTRNHGKGSKVFEATVDPGQKLYFVDAQVVTTNSKEQENDQIFSTNPVFPEILDKMNRKMGTFHQKLGYVGFSQDLNVLDEELSEQLEQISAVQDHRMACGHDAAFVARTYNQNTGDLLMWHRRLGHWNFADVARLLGLKLPAKPIFCESCVLGKSKRHELNKKRREPLHSAPRPAYLFHMDVAGPFRSTTRGGNRYILVLVDDYSRRPFVFLLKTTSEVSSVLQDFVKQIENEFGRKNVVAQLLADGASYFEKSTVLRDYCRKKGIYQLFSPPYTPSLNGVAERMIGTIVTMVRTMLVHAGAPKFLWGEATAYAAHLIARLPRDAKLASDTRLELWTSRPQSTSHKHLRVWGCAAWVKDFDIRRDKLSPTSQKHIFVGIDPQMKCYRLARLPRYEIVRSAHVVFNEEEFPCRERKKVSSSADDAAADFAAASPEVIADDYAPMAAARPRREWTPSVQALENIASAIVEDAVYGVQTDCPRSHVEAMNTADKDKWRQAEIAEWHSLMDKGALGPDLDRPPPGFKSIPMAPVYTKKRDGRYKCRVVVRGYHMQQGRDYNHTFAPVPNITLFRVMFALTAKYDWEGKQGDAPNAFMQPTVDAELYVTVPPGMHDDPSTKIRPGIDDRNTKTCRQLLHGVNGIPQGTYLWTKKTKITCEKVGLKRCESDFSFYYDVDSSIYLLLWVDDIFLFFPKTSSQKARKVWSGLQADLKVGEWADIDDCLGCIVTRDRPSRTIKLSQKPAVVKLLKKAGMDKCSSSDTPVAAGMIFTKDDCPTDTSESATWYRSILASCIYMAMWTRPDIAFAISKLSKFMANPGEKHVQGLKRLLRYLAGTVDQGLLYSFAASPPREGVYGYYDAAHADDIDTRRSTMAYVFFYEGCPISWHSKLHTYVTTSTNHSEYCAAAKAAREAKWLEKIYCHIKFEDAVKPIALFSDSQGAIAMNYNPVQRNTSKHVDLADHYAREQVERGTITINYVPTDKMIADIGTKALAKGPFSELAKHIVSKL